MCSWLISCEIIISDLIKSTEKFVPIYMLFKIKKCFKEYLLYFLGTIQQIISYGHGTTGSWKDKIPHFQKSFSVSVNWSILQDKSEYLMSLSPHSFSTMFYHHRIDISGIHCLTKDCIFILSKILWLQYPKWEFKVSNLYFIVYHRESFAQKYFPVIHYFHLNAIMDVLNIKHIKHCYITADCAIALVLLIGHLLG